MSTSGFCLFAMADQVAQAAPLPTEAQKGKGSSVRTTSRARVAYADILLSQARERLRYLLVKGAGPRLLGRAPTISCVIVACSSISCCNVILKACACHQCSCLPQPSPKTSARGALND